MGEQGVVFAADRVQAHVPGFARQRVHALRSEGGADQPRRGGALVAEGALAVAFQISRVGAGTIAAATAPVAARHVTTA